MADKSTNATGRAGLLRQGSRWAKAPDVAYYMLWFEFLKISPSYELARRMRSGLWAPDDETRKPADFDMVLAIYDDLGDLHQSTFREWWLRTAIDYFGHLGDKPVVTQLAMLRHNPKPDRGKLSAVFESYLDNRWGKQGEPDTMVLAIPLGLPKAQIAKNVAALMAKYPSAHNGFGERPPKYQLLKKRLNSGSLFKYLHCFWLKSRHPKLPLWRVGAYASLSNTYSQRFAKGQKMEPGQQTEDRTALKVLTSRAISRGLLIAENAARGHFPTYAKLEFLTEPDWRQSKVIVEKRLALERRQRREAKPV